MQTAYEEWECRPRQKRIVQGNKRWTVHRVEDVSDQSEALGTYQSRREANKALGTIAYAPEPHR
jgi:hypothetical protein